MRGYSTALMLLLALPLSSASAEDPSTRAEAYERCIAYHFAVPGVTTNDQRRFASMVTVRALQGHCSREVQATLATPFEPSGDISVSVIRSKNGNSLLEQLEKLEAQYPDRSYDELCREIEVVREALRVGADHPVRDRVREMERLNISPMPPSDVVLDGNRYFVQIWSGFGQASFTFYGTGRSEDPSITALEVWLLQVFRDLELTCPPPRHSAPISPPHPGADGSHRSRSGRCG